MALTKYDIKTAHARVTFSGFLDTEVEHALLRVPGVKARYGAWAVAHHATEPFKAVLREYGVMPETVYWVRPKPRVTDWADVDAKLRASGEVRDFVLDGFLTGFQKDAISWGWRREGCNLWHPTGSGKTLTSIMLALQPPRMPILFVARAPACLQMAREFQKYTTLIPYVVRPRSQRRKKSKRISDYRAECAAAGRREVLIIGWPALPGAIQVLENYGFGSVVFDELHTVKSTKRYDVMVLDDPKEFHDDLPKALRVARKEKELLAQYTGSFVKDSVDGRRLLVPTESIAASAGRLARQVHKRIGLTATPVKDRVRDLWGQLDTIEPNSWGSATVWLDRYADRRPGTYGGYDTKGESNVAELKQRLDQVAHILTYEQTHRELPPKRRQSFYIAPDDQVRPLGGFANEMKRAQKRGATAVLEAKLAMSASMKRKAVLDLLEDHLYEGHKITIFTARIKDCADLVSMITKSPTAKRLQAPVWGLDGTKSNEVRQRDLDAYMRHEGACVLVATGQSTGESLEIQDTDVAMFVMLPYTPGQLRQWEGRFHRPGMTRPVTIYYIIAEGTADEHVASILIDKLPAVEKLAQDVELADASDILAGFDGMGTDEECAQSILDFIDDDT